MTQPNRPSPLRGWWLLSTVLILALAGLFIRLATWQLERLGERRAANALVLARLAEPSLSITGELLDPDEVDLRRATVRGVYYYDQEIILRNRTWNGFPGVHVLTPLRIAGSDTAILVDRGWIPYESASVADRAQFRAVAGEVEVYGILRKSQPRRGMSPEDSTPSLAGPRIDAWHRVDLPKIRQQLPFPLLTVFLEEDTPPGAEPRQFPKPLPEISLDEGSHMVYAIQWFAFAFITVAGYIGVYVQRTTEKSDLTSNSTEVRVKR